MTATELSTPDSPVTLELGDYVKVVNRDDTVHRLTWNSKPYLLPPNAEAIVPFELAKLYFGDPRAVEQMSTHRDQFGLVSWIPDRESEIRRLRCLYDNQMGDETKIVNHPNVEVYDLMGARVLTVLDDPAGDSVNPHIATVSQNDEMMLLIQKQQRTIEMLMQRVGLADADTDRRTNVIDPSEALNEPGDEGEQELADALDFTDSGDELPRDED